MGSSTEYSFDLYGTGPHKDELIRLKNTLKLNNITINNPVYENEMNKIMANCNAYIQTSRWETFGRSIMEAVAHGLPVIISEGCNLRDTIIRENLGLVINYNYKISAKKIVDYLADYDSLLKVSKNNLKFAKNEYDLVLIAMKNLKFYQKVIGAQTI